VTTPALYRGTELDALASARNYYRWIIARCREHLGRVVVEHGAGAGNFSLALLEAGVGHLAAVEPAGNLVPTLTERLAPWGRRASIWASTLEEFVVADHRLAVDTIVSVNVLEHIADDRTTLRTMAALVRPGGSVIVFVPALPWLYGSLDRAFDHVRRYRRDELLAKARGAGLEVLDVHFINIVGVLTWFVMGRVLRRPTLTAASVKLFDRVAIPLISRIEGVWSPPIGQNLLLISRKPGG
jgi:SAM-dependent methyltransferase